VAAAVGDPSARGWVQEVTGIYCLGQGRFEAATGQFELALDACRRLGDWQHWGEIMACRAQMAYYQGQLELGESIWIELFETARKRGDELQRAWGLNGRAEAALKLHNDAAAAAGLVEEALALYSRNVDYISEIGSLGLQATARAARGEMEAARRAAEQGVTLADKLSRPTGYYSLTGYAGIASCLLALSKANAADVALVRLARRACRHMDRYARAFPIGEPAAWRCRGLWHARHGKDRRARRCWQRGLASAERLGMRFELELLKVQLSSQDT
jgi:tetratricopeptide (TPR) repeat protein